MQTQTRIPAHAHQGLTIALIQVKKAMVKLVMLGRRVNLVLGKNFNRKC